VSDRKREGKELESGQRRKDRPEMEEKQKAAKLLGKIIFAVLAF
jgi:hypothetical protein